MAIQSFLSKNQAKKVAAKERSTAAHIKGMYPHFAVWHDTSTKSLDNAESQDKAIINNIKDIKNEHIDAKFSGRTPSRIIEPAKPRERFTFPVVAFPKPVSNIILKVTNRKVPAGKVSDQSPKAVTAASPKVSHTTVTPLLVDASVPAQNGRANAASVKQLKHVSKAIIQPADTELFHFLSAPSQHVRKIAKKAFKNVVAPATKLPGTLEKNITKIEPTTEKKGQKAREFEAVANRVSSMSSSVSYITSCTDMITATKDCSAKTGDSSSSSSNSTSSCKPSISSDAGDQSDSSVSEIDGNKNTHAYVNNVQSAKTSKKGPAALRRSAEREFVRRTDKIISVAMAEGTKAGFKADIPQAVHGLDRLISRLNKFSAANSGIERTLRITICDLVAEGINVDVIEAAFFSRLPGATRAIEVVGIVTVATVQFMRLFELNKAAALLQRAAAARLQAVLSHADEAVSENPGLAPEKSTVLPPPKKDSISLFTTLPNTNSAFTFDMPVAGTSATSTPSTRPQMTFSSAFFAGAPPSTNKIAVATTDTLSGNVKTSKASSSAPLEETTSTDDGVAISSDDHAAEIESLVSDTALPMSPIFLSIASLLNAPVELPVESPTSLAAASPDQASSPSAYHSMALTLYGNPIPVIDQADYPDYMDFRFGGDTEPSTPNESDDEDEQAAASKQEPFKFGCGSSTQSSAPTSTSFNFGSGEQIPTQSTATSTPNTINFSDISAQPTARSTKNSSKFFGRGKASACPSTRLRQKQPRKSPRAAEFQHAPAQCEENLEDTDCEDNDESVDGVIFKTGTLYLQLVDDGTELIEDEPVKQLLAIEWYGSDTSSENAIRIIRELSSDCSGFVTICVDVVPQLALDWPFTDIPLHLSAPTSSDDDDTNDEVSENLSVVFHRPAFEDDVGTTFFNEPNIKNIILLFVVTAILYGELHQSETQEPDCVSSQSHNDAASDHVDSPEQPATPPSPPSSPVNNNDSSPVITTDEYPKLAQRCADLYLGIYNLSDFYNALNSISPTKSSKLQITTAFLKLSSQERVELGLGSVHPFSADALRANDARAHRVKLGNIKLADFLKMLAFGEDGSTSNASIIKAWETCANMKLQSPVLKPGLLQGARELGWVV
ncbi:hypothetical protein J1614_006897 [Plenodomus biglobosus]|nr:hypothetical protein J1614_006897 [Plenodomus biglobosus]